MSRNERYRYRYTIWGVLAIVYYLFIGGMAAAVILFGFISPIAGVSHDLQLLLVGIIVLLIAAPLIIRPGYITKANLATRIDILRATGSKWRASRPTQSPSFRRDGQYVAGASGKGWRLADYKYDVDYPVGRGATVVGEHRYISLLELDLPRQLPAMVFDSKRGVHALGKGLDRSQRTTLGGNFDDVFVTYFPLHYHIDARSIVSTPTMQAMLALDDCDFEIFDDKLHIYHAMVDDNKVAEFIARGEAVKRTLSRPLKNYRDHLVGSATDRQSVSIVGARLRESVGTELVMIAIGVLLFVSLVAGIVRTDEVSVGGAIFGMFFVLLFIGGGWASYHRKRSNNKRLDDEYRQRSLGRKSISTLDDATHGKQTSSKK